MSSPTPPQKSVTMASLCDRRSRRMTFPTPEGSVVPEASGKHSSTELAKKEEETKGVRLPKLKRKARTAHPTANQHREVKSVNAPVREV
ncbi:unnamed protein product [Linum trigynum]|uniref:Uncharacterized protein n=1 Tax=Linum trigynum TaxID=586398 RepID=A0AAV2GBT8_9ROSI